jgi:hypothetical protein
MPVTIGEVEVVPQQAQQPETRQSAPAPAADALKPELVHEIAKTVSLLQARDVRLAAS